jgi:hypothetical protein
LHYSSRECRQVVKYLVSDDCKEENVTDLALLVSEEIDYPLSVCKKYIESMAPIRDEIQHEETYLQLLAGLRGRFSFCLEVEPYLKVDKCDSKIKREIAFDVLSASYSSMTIDLDLEITEDDYQFYSKWKEGTRNFSRGSVHDLLKLSHILRDNAEISDLKKTIEKAVYSDVDIESILRGIRRLKTPEPYLLSGRDDDIPADFSQCFEMLLKKGKRSGFAYSTDLLGCIYDGDLMSNSKTLGKINSLGRKKKLRLFDTLSKFNGIYTTTLISKELTDFLETHEISEFDLFVENQHRKVLNQFGIDKLPDSILTYEFQYLYAGYYKNKDDPNALPLVSSVLQEKSLLEYREMQLGRSLDGILAALHKPFLQKKQVDEEFVIDSKRIGKENYDEALIILERAGVSEERDGNYMAHATSLVERYKASENEVIQEAVEHLEKVIDSQNRKNIKTNELIYKTGNLKDFAFIGEYPRETCLGFSRMNSKYMMSMATQPTIMPFIVAIENEEGKEILVSRALLRVYEDRLIVDDIYGESVDILDPIAEYASSIGLEIGIPERQYDSLTSSDKQFVKKNFSFATIDEHIEYAIYSDSLGGRIENQTKTYEAHIMKAS